MKRHINPTRVPIGKKESIRWLKSVQDCHRIASVDPTKLIHIGDRECDIYELFCEYDKLGTFYIARSCVNRLAEEANIVELIALHPPDFRHAITFLDENGHQIEAILQVKVQPLTLHPPIGKEAFYPDLNVVVIHAMESRNPKSRKRIKWTFITNLPVTTKKDAIKVLNFYKQRWKIELYFKILKSGLRIEGSKLRTMDRLSHLLSMSCILAWRIAWITMLNREQRDLSPQFGFDKQERLIIEAYARKKKLDVNTLQDFATVVARLGGYFARANDSPPGNTVMWRGLNRLRELRLGFELARNVGN